MSLLKQIYVTTNDSAYIAIPSPTASLAILPTAILSLLPTPFNETNAPHQTGRLRLQDREPSLTGAKLALQSQTQKLCLFSPNAI